MMADDVYARQGFGRELGLGAQPALLLVDFVNGFLDPDAFGSKEIVQAMERTVPLLALARRLNLPVAHSRIVFADDGADGNVFTAKVPTLLGLTETAAASQIAEPLTPRSGELVVRKTLPSAFRGAGLSAWLTSRRVDSVIVAGCTTSGCVRASVIDAMAEGFIPVVVSDCVGDRAEAPHQANLFDMRQKCGDVLPFTELAGRLEAQAAGAAS
jgi:maleamate amidohydrolase